MNLWKCWASSHFLTPIISMSLKYLKLGVLSSVKKRKAKHMALEQYETFFCTGEEQYFHHRISGDRRQSQEWEKIKKKWSNCRKHICLLSLQLNYLSREMNFPLRRQADTGPHVQGKSSISIFSLLKRGSQAQEIKALHSNYRELVVTQRKSTISSLFGKATWQWGKITAHVLICCCLARWFSTVISKLIGNIPTENLCCLYITEKL